MAAIPGMPDPGGAPGGGGGMPPLPGAPPSLPKSPAGTPPTGPGGSPALSPGDSAGRTAGAMHQVRAVLPALLTASMAFPAGSKEQQALIRAVSALNPLFGKADAGNMVPAALRNMVQTAGGPGGPAGSQPPPLGGPGAKPPGPSLGPGNMEIGGETP